MENSRNGWGKRSEESPFCTTSACRIPSSSKRRFNEERYEDMEKADFRKRDDSEADDRSLGIQEEVEEIGPAAKAPFSGPLLARSIGKA
ncbi:unnamed protein product [Leuciscus chuanchicus]